MLTPPQHQSPTDKKQNVPILRPLACQPQRPRLRGLEHHRQHRQARGRRSGEDEVY
jgi:hypothetical protein